MSTGQIDGPITKVKIELAAGKSVSEAFTLADWAATRLGMPVAFDFCGKEEVFDPRELAANRVERWFLEQRGRQQREEEAAEAADRERDRQRLPPLPTGFIHAIPNEPKSS